MLAVTGVAIILLLVAAVYAWDSQSLKAAQLLADQLQASLGAHGRVEAQHNSSSLPDSLVQVPQKFDKFPVDWQALHIFRSQVFSEAIGWASRATVAAISNGATS